MGDVVNAKTGNKINLQRECVDSLGLASVRIIKDGQQMLLIEPKGETRVVEVMEDTFAGGKSYYRVECLAVDRRRAYSNPIYIAEA